MLELCEKCGEKKYEEELDWKHPCRFCFDVYCLKCMGTRKRCWVECGECHRKDHFLCCLKCEEKFYANYVGYKK